MNVLSFTAYKEKSVSGPLDDNVVVNLPAAPLSVARTKYEDSGTGKAHCVTPGESLAWIGSHGAVSEGGAFTVVIAGPGDPLATPEQTIDVMETVRSRYPHASFALRTYGIGGSGLAEKLAGAGVRYVELVADAVDVASLEEKYLWIRPARKTLPLPRARELLVEEQRKAIIALRQEKITVCGCITLYEEGDEVRMPGLANSLKEFGVDQVAFHVHNEAGVREEQLESVKDTIDGLPVVGSLAAQFSQAKASEEEGSAGSLPRQTRERPNVAVVSSNGMEVDLHLGHADRILIYGPRSDGLPCLLEARDAPKPGGGRSRWVLLAEKLADCFVLLAAGAGESPKYVLGEYGIRVLTVQDNIDGLVDVLYGGGKRKKKRKDNPLV